MSNCTCGASDCAYCTFQRGEAEPPKKHCKAYCGSRWDTHTHNNDSGEIYQDMPERVRMTRCFCTADCRKAGKALNPAKVN